MRTYRVVISICSTDKGPPEHAETTHNVSAGSIQELVDHATDVVQTFASTETIDKAVAEHKKLVDAQNKEPSKKESHAKADSK